jgi:hypothetical protein
MRSNEEIQKNMSEFLIQKDSKHDDYEYNDSLRQIHFGDKEFEAIHYGVIKNNIYESRTGEKILLDEGDANILFNNILDLHEYVFMDNDKNIFGVIMLEEIKISTNSSSVQNVLEASLE